MFKAGMGVYGTLWSEGLGCIRLVNTKHGRM